MYDANDISKVSDVTSEELKCAVDKLKKDNKLSYLSKHFIEEGKKYGVNSLILMSIACLESGYGMSKLAQEKNNLFGLDARDSLKGQANYGKDFSTKEECITHAAHRLGYQYLKLDESKSYRYCGGKKDIWSIGEKWCSKRDWGDKVINIANRLKKEIEANRSEKDVDYKKLYTDLHNKVDNFIKELEKEK